jgi:riboflavin-specific deaminase-like protein
MFPFEKSLANAAAYCQASGRPLVTLTYAQSLDGSLAVQRGQTVVLSGPESLKLTHQLRAAHDAILVGIGTVLADDPRLTVRMAAGNHPQPIVLDSTLRISPQSKLVAEAVHPLWIATTKAAPDDRRAALAARGVQFLDLPGGSQGGVLLPDLLFRLAGNGINSLMVEGGARVITSFLKQQLVNQVLLTISPCFVGGLPALSDPVASGFPRLRDIQVELLGEDLIVWGTLSTMD